MINKMKQEETDGSVFKNYIGLPRSGKTLSAVEENIIKAYLSGIPIWSNSWFNLKGINYFTDVEEILHVRNCAVFFDEIGDVIDPYNWQLIPQPVRRFFRFHGKRYIDIYATTQDVSFVAKPARVLISSWVYNEKNDYGSLIKKILSWFNYGEVRIKQQELTTFELSKLQKGIGANPLVDDLESEEDDFSDDLDLSEVNKTLESPIKKISYSYKRLLHKELNEFKIELVHRYCPECRSRQSGLTSADKDLINSLNCQNVLDYILSCNQNILKDDTDKICTFDLRKKKYFLNEIEYCPKHPKQELEIKETGIYDTLYELEIPDNDIEWRPFIKCPPGYQMIPYKGALSDKNYAQRSNLSR